MAAGSLAGCPPESMHAQVGLRFPYITKGKAQHPTPTCEALPFLRGLSLSCSLRCADPTRAAGARCVVRNLEGAAGSAGWSVTGRARAREATLASPAGDRRHLSARSRLRCARWGFQVSVSPLHIACEPMLIFVHTARPGWRSAEARPASAAHAIYFPAFAHGART